ncbi:MAG TPA: hypothetical protein VH392_06150, partial [Sphingomicrobium sp.]
RCTAKHDAAAVAELESLYLQAARESIAESREASHEIFSRDVPYVLLMHVSAMSAHMMPQLLQLYREAGFRFVSLPAAESDPVYRAYTDPRLPPPPTPQELAKAKHVQLERAPDHSARLNAICT